MSYGIRRIVNGCAAHQVVARREAIDYKTGRRPKEPNQLQLMVYALVLTKRLGRPVSQATHLYLNGEETFSIQPEDDVIHWAGRDGFPVTENKQMRARIEVDQSSVADFCRRHHIRKLSLFGSVLREDFRPDSDVDVLVEFEPGQVVGLIRLAGLERELSEIIGRKVDLRTPAELSRYFRTEVTQSAEALYTEG